MVPELRPDPRHDRLVAGRAHHAAALLRVSTATARLRCVAVAAWGWAARRILAGSNLTSRRCCLDRNPVEARRHDSKHKRRSPVTRDRTLSVSCWVPGSNYGGLQPRGVARVRAPRPRIAQTQQKHAKLSTDNVCELRVTRTSLCRQNSLCRYKLRESQVIHSHSGESASVTTLNMLLCTVRSSHYEIKKITLRSPPFYYLIKDAWQC